MTSNVIPFEQQHAKKTDALKENLTSLFPAELLAAGEDLIASMAREHRLKANARAKIEALLPDYAALDSNGHEYVRKAVVVDELPTTNQRSMCLELMTPALAKDLNIPVSKLYFDKRVYESVSMTLAEARNSHFRGILLANVCDLPLSLLDNDALASAGASSAWAWSVMVRCFVTLPPLPAFANNEMATAHSNAQTG